MLKVFAVRDVKGEVFGQPMFIPSVGEAVRGFRDACEAPDSMLRKHASDYALYELGTYDPRSGLFDSLKLPVLLCEAAAVVAELKENQKEIIQ